MPQQLIDLRGEHFGELDVLYRVEGPTKGTYWLCRCSCGKEVIVERSYLTRMRSPKRHCGHAKTRILHGDSGSKLYNIWTGIKQRCSNSRHISYKNYGGRGIGIDYSPWLVDYTKFRDWAYAFGYKEELDIDRIDNSLGYSPDNCRFVSRTENSRNKRTNVFITGFGETKTLGEWLNDSRIHPSVTRRVLQKRAAKREMADWDMLCVPASRWMAY